jgi:hypothetical protein
MYIQIIDVVTGDIVKAFYSMEEADNWVYSQDNPQQYEAIVDMTKEK